jgi:hypothetical protein
MGVTDKCGILFHAGSTTTDIGLLLVAQANLYKFLLEPDMLG